MIITAFYTGLLGLLLLVLSIRVATVRINEKVSLGVAENRRLERRVRAQGNLAEYAALTMLMLALLELLNAAPLLLHLLGGTFLVGRLLHAWGLSTRSGASWQRLSGILLSWLAMLLMALMLVAESALRIWARGL